MCIRMHIYIYIWLRLKPYWIKVSFRAADRHPPQHSSGMARNTATVAAKARGAMPAEGAAARWAPAAHQAIAAEPQPSHPASESLSALRAIPTIVKEIPARTNPSRRRPRTLPGTAQRSSRCPTCCSPAAARRPHSRVPSSTAVAC